MSQLLLIDADSLAYQSSKDSLEESLLVLDEKITNMFVATGATSYIMFLTMGSSFRNALSGEYKHGRKPTLKWIHTLKGVLIDKYHAVYMSNVEADDLVALYKMERRPDGKVCSPDKDLLLNLPGEHFNYSYITNKETGKTVKGRPVTTFQADATLNFWRSMVTGDPGDRIAGLRGKGPAFFNKNISYIPEESRVEGVLAYKVFHMYLEHFGESHVAVEAFSRNYMLLRPMQTTWEFTSNVKETPPLYKEIEIKYPAMGTIELTESTTNLPDF